MSQSIFSQISFSNLCNQLERFKEKVSKRFPHDPYVKARMEMLDEAAGRMFMLGGFIGACDTYKRTMWTAVPDVALEDSAYALTMRRGLSEAGAGDGLIMAGHEMMLAQWFHKPLDRDRINLARRWFKEQSNVKAFPDELWDYVLNDYNKGARKVYLPVDIYGFPGGQTFLKGVPCMSFENGPGGIISWLEPAMCRYFAPVIQATKARLMSDATDRDAEFGLRAAVNEMANIVLLMARYVGGRGSLTSNDTAEFLFPELLKAIGTIGHEMMCSNQSLDRSLAEAEYEMMDKFVAKMGVASLLCDLVDATTVGFENAIKVIKAHPETNRAGIRVDSGDIAAQCIQYYQGMLAEGIEPRTIVFEDEVTPEAVRRVYTAFKEATGVEPTMLFPGAGGYWWKLVHRDEVSAAFKRTMTSGRPNVKFSNSEGKESLSGTLRVYEQGRILVVADVSESIDGKPLFVQLVKGGRIVYNESLPTQANRADATWGKYDKFVLSPQVASWQEAYRAKRRAEIAAAQKRLAAKEKLAA